jgi:transposase-like protein
MERVKKIKTRRVFDDDFKAENVKMRIAAHLNSGKNVPELSTSFDIAENIFARRSVSLENQPEYEETDKNF